MLRTNLSTRPFYNERGVYWVLALAAAAIVALTIYNVTHILSLSRQQARLSAEIAQDESRARALATQAQRVKATIDQAALERIITAAREANAVIDERTFSWTELFNHIERTLPSGVMLTAVQPRVDKGKLTVAMVVLGREVEYVDSFIEKLEETGAFSHVLASAEAVTEEGMFQVTLSGQYRPSSSGAAPAGAPAEGDAAPAEGEAGGGAAEASPAAPAAGQPAAPASPAPAQKGTTPAKPAPQVAPAPGKAAPSTTPPTGASPRRAVAAAEARS